MMAPSIAFPAFQFQGWSLTRYRLPPPPAPWNVTAPLPRYTATEPGKYPVTAIDWLPKKRAAAGVIAQQRDVLKSGEGRQLIAPKGAVAGERQPIGARPAGQTIPGIE